MAKGKPKAESGHNGPRPYIESAHEYRKLLGRLGWTQMKAARRLGITQPRLNDLLHGKINKFSLDTLMTLATRAGLKVKIDVRSAA